MSKSKIKKVFVAMSGGVDSSVAALLLSGYARSREARKHAGYNVVGVFMKNWSQNLAGGECAWAQDQEDARKVAAKIGIPIYTFDFEEEYKERVVDYMLKEYAAGRTPNPDVMCNKEIKFGLFLEKALSLGADFVATGHYARLHRKLKTSRFAGSREAGQNPKPKTYSLAIARDLNKDQSYFLWTLTQEQLRHCLFPIGDYLKSEVREIARKFGLPTADKKDSQGVCFIGKFDFAEFLKSKIPANPGVIKTVDGKVVGEHEGLAFYTIGQRKGIGVGGIGPFYVAAKDEKENALIVAPDNAHPGLFQSELAINDIHWISGVEPSLPLKCEARIRYRQSLQRCTIDKFSRCAGSREARQAVFDAPQRAITPGQSIVFYKGKEMLGGGIIE